MAVYYVKMPKVYSGLLKPRAKDLENMTPQDRGLCRVINHTDQAGRLIIYRQHQGLEVLIVFGNGGYQILAQSEPGKFDVCVTTKLQSLSNVIESSYADVDGVTIALATITCSDRVDRWYYEKDLRDSGDSIYEYMPYMKPIAIVHDLFFVDGKDITKQAYSHRIGVAATMFGDDPIQVAKPFTLPLAPCLAIMVRKKYHGLILYCERNVTTMSTTQPQFAGRRKAWVIPRS